MSEPVPIFERIRSLGIASWSLVGAAAVVWILIWLIGKLAVLWPPIVLAIVLIYLFNPITNRLADRKIPRPAAGCLAYLIFGGLLVLVGFLVLPAIANQATDLSDRFPELVETTTEWATDVAADFGVDISAGQVGSISTEIQDWFRDPANQEVILGYLGNVGSIALGVFELIILILVAPVLAFYVLMDEPTLKKNALQLVPESVRDEVAHVSTNVAHAVGGFIRGQLLVAIIIGVLSSIGLRILDLPFWLIVGLLAGFLNIVPFVGPWVGGFLGVMTALIVGDFSKAIWVAVIFAVIQQLDNQIISPVILRVTVKLHPATILLALLAGASLGGLFGVLIAVPVTAVLKIVLGHLWRTRFLGESWEEARGAMLIEHEPERLRDRLRRVGDLEVHELSEELAEHEEHHHDGREPDPD